MSGRPAWLPALAIMVAALSLPAWSGEAPGLPMVAGLSADLHAPVLLPRPNAPWPIVVSLTLRSSALRTGKLQVEVKEGRRTLCHWWSDERVLTSGVNAFSVLIPPMALENEHEQLTCALRWYEHGELLDVGSATQPMSNGDRLLYLAMLQPLAAGDSARHAQHGLALELSQLRVAQDDDPHQPGVQNPIQDRPRLRTVPVHLSDEECPDSALGWCAFDAAVIVGDRLRALKAPHIAALEQWVLAGGSCCLVCDGDLPRTIADVVQRASVVDGLPEGPTPGRHARMRLGLGRIVVVREEAAGQEGAAVAAEWARSAAFLWKMRRDAGERFVSTGTWDLVEQAPENPSHPGGGSRYARYDMPLDLSFGIYRLLWPEHVQAVPLALVLAVFAVFILMIGPGEWFLLGWLRARRFTWVVFPLLAILCTCSMVWISRYFLGIEDVRQRLDVIDVGAGGQLLRRNRCELVFTGATKEVVDEPHGALRCPLPITQYRHFRNGPPPPGHPAVYRGNLAGSYSLTQTIPQWTPILVRELSLTPAPLPWRLDLDGIRRPGDAEAVARAWIGAMAGHAAAVMIQHGQVTAQWGDRQVLAPILGGEIPIIQYLFLALNAHPASGWFSLFSGMSPAGGAVFDDVPLLDASDPDEFAIVCIQHREGSWLLVRRVFHSGAGGPDAIR